MNVFVIVESCYGNTRRLADEISQGIRNAGSDVVVESASRAPMSFDDDIDLVIAGAPTHGFSLPNASTRQNAAFKSKDEGNAIESLGLREWIEHVELTPQLHIVLFSTVMRGFSLLGSANKGGTKALRARGFERVSNGEAFFVKGSRGPIAEGELHRARAWGESLVS